MTAEIKEIRNKKKIIIGVEHLMPNSEKEYETDIPGAIIFSDDERTAVILPRCIQITRIRSNGGIRQWCDENGDYKGTSRVDLIKNDYVQFKHLFREWIVRHVK
jgi:hypothetical protein